MPLRYLKIPYGSAIPPGGQSVVYLKENNWDDFDYKTQYFVILQDEQGRRFEIGDIKIGYVGQTSPGWTRDSIPTPAFSNFGDGFFSIGQDPDYYKNIISEDFPVHIRDELLIGLKDVIADNELYDRIHEEDVFVTSLTRGIRQPTLDQYRRLLHGDAALTEYNFNYQKQKDDSYSGINLEFNVDPNIKPSTNIHVLIGRNGIGKTTTLNNMVGALVSNDPECFGYFSDPLLGVPIDPNTYFSGVVSVSFSAFDPFTPPREKNDRDAGMCYSYIGLKDITYDADGTVESERHKDASYFAKEFFASARACFSLEAKKRRWLTAIENLQSDNNFSEMGLGRLVDIEGDKELAKESFRLFTKKLSSGHAIVLLTITKLIEKVEEKTLVIMDEPESHLHPPLLSAFTRALSTLLINRNGLAIVATHSPVMLQEVPACCVWKIRRTHLQMNWDRPDAETFGENVGVLTREVFGLEVNKSGFYDLLSRSVDRGATYDFILNEYGGRLGFEGKAVLRALIANRVADQEDQ